MKRFLAILLVVIVCFSMIASVSAANVCGNISGNAKSTKTFTINTGSRWLGSDKVKFTQTKGTYEYRTLLSSSKTKTDYMCYKVSYRIKGTSAWTTKQWKGKNLTLSLKKNKVYEVKVVPFSNIDMSVQTGRQIRSWKKTATWSVTSTKGIISCN